MTTFNELPFELHMKIFDLCIENKAEYLMNEIYNALVDEKNDNFHIFPYSYPFILQDTKWLRDYLCGANKEHLIKGLGSLRDIIYKFHSWLDYKQEDGDKVLIANHEYIIMVNKYYEFEIQVDDFINTTNGRIKTYKFYDRHFYYKYKGQNTKINVLSDEFYNMNKNDNYFL